MSRVGFSSVRNTVCSLSCWYRVIRELDDGDEVSGVADAEESVKEHAFDEIDHNWEGNGEDGWGEIVNESENGNNFGVDNEESVGDGVEKNDEERSGRPHHQYPLRPEAEDCAFYLKTGTCKFGFNCKFNHPLRRKSQVFFFIALICCSMNI